METAFAVIGLSFQLFESAVACYRFIATAQGLRRDARIQFWKLRIQEVRLQTWGRQWSTDRKGFETFLLEENLAEDVKGLLILIRDLLEDSSKLKERYGLKIEGFAETPQTQSSSDATNRVPAKSNWSRKFLWSLKDKDKFEVLVNDLREVNDGLYCIFDASARKSLIRYTESEVLRLTEDAGDVEGIRQACIAYRDETQQRPSPQRRLDYTYTDLAEAVKAKQLLIDQAVQAPLLLGTGMLSDVNRTHERDPALVVGYLKRTPTDLRVLAEYQERTVLLEWKAIDSSSPYQPLIAQRLEDLATLLAPEAPKPSDFRVLNCFGYFKDTTLPRYGYIFELPQHAAPRPPVTLHNLMARGGAQDILPELGDRFALARNLAASLLRLHECGWVHTSFRSDSILLFFSEEHDAPATSGPVFQSPYISGFGYSKPSDPAESTIEYSTPNQINDLYRHPQILRSRGMASSAQRTRHQQRHDLFALGIVLLEIGLWEQVKALWKDKYTPTMFLEKLLTAYVPRLGHKMGAIYREVVSDLLNMRLEEGVSAADQVMFGEQKMVQTSIDHGSKGTELKDLDWWRVVMRLEKCRA